MSHIRILMQDGKKVNSSPIAQNRARKQLNERREQLGMEPVLGANEIDALLRQTGRELCSKPSPPAKRPQPDRHYVKRKALEGGQF